MTSRVREAVAPPSMGSGDKPVSSRGSRLAGGEDSGSHRVLRCDFIRGEGESCTLSLLPRLDVTMCLDSKVTLLNSKVL